jgi:gamma-tubulin complex component 3
MAPFNHERVGHALDELLQRIVPDDPNDSEEVAEERLQDAYERSMEQLVAAGEPKAVPDVHHITRLLEAKSKATHCRPQAIRQTAYSTGTCD